MDQEAKYWRDKWKEAVRVAQMLRAQLAELESATQAPRANDRPPHRNGRKNGH